MEIPWRQISLLKLPISIQELIPIPDLIPILVSILIPFPEQIAIPRSIPILIPASESAPELIPNTESDSDRSDSKLLPLVHSSVSQFKSKPLENKQPLNSVQ